MVISLIKIIFQGVIKSRLKHRRPVLSQLTEVTNIFISHTKHIIQNNTEDRILIKFLQTLVLISNQTVRDPTYSLSHITSF